MLKKSFIMLCFMFLLLTTPKTYAYFSDGFAIGFGITTGVNGYGAYDVGGVISAKIPKVPMVIGLSPNYKNSNGLEYFGFGLNIDFWLFQHTFTDLLHMYMGAGFGLNFDSIPNAFHFDLGFRIPIGMQFLFNDKYELFVEFTPHLFFLYAGTAGAKQALEFRISGTVGIRFWI